MHIVIPMSGVGRRFQKAGYTDPKPLIQADGLPIIAHVVNLFPGETKFTFICNIDHLESTPLASVLKRICPTGVIIPILSHQKGPVFAVQAAFDRIDDDEEVIVNYCDFSSYWNYSDFLEDTRSRKAAGCVVSYRGFHPHMLGTDHYAFVKDTNRWLEAIQEKQPFTDNRMSEFASNGTYYFAQGHDLKHYFKQLLAEGPGIKGEYYVSMVYNLMVADGLPVSVYEVEHMLQWGTPYDLQAYQQWSDYFASLAKQSQFAWPIEPDSLTVIPLAGQGKRFQDEGFTVPKPLILVDDTPMVVAATQCLPPSSDYRFVCRQDHLDHFPLADSLTRAYPNGAIIGLETMTEGQACTCVLGLPSDADALDRPLMVGACDNGMVLDQDKFLALRNNPEVDAIAFTFQNHPASRRNPHMYGWIAVDDSQWATNVSVKVPVSETPEQDHAIVGSFYFRKARYLVEALAALQQRDERINGEFYIDSCIGEMVTQGYRVKVFPVTHYVCWGTPDDWRTYTYWQSFFQKCPWHAYQDVQDASGESLINLIINQ